jgi:two-component system, OmpR family, heavy metal sensor histidine kinase CusS
LYCIVLSLSFAAFFWISDIGFQRSIEATVNEASRTNLETIQRLLTRKAGLNNDGLHHELVDLSDVWANGALFEVADGNGNWIFRPARFTDTYPALPAVRDHGITFFTANLDYFEYRIALQRVQLAGKTFEIHAAVPTEPFDQALDHFRLIEKEALPLLVLLASLLGYWLSGWSLAPVKRIIETTESIGVQNLSRRLEVPRARDELRRLTETLNAMLARIEKSVTRITQFTADASHDLRTPVAVIRATAEITLRRKRTEAGYRDALTKILETSVETSELLENLLMLARADNSVAAIEMKAIDLRNHVGKVKERAVLLSADKGLRFTARTPVEPVWVKADGIAIDRLLLILVDNAVKYSASGGKCEIELSRDGAKAQVAVRDWGIGISEIDLPSIFERFVRADRTRSRDTPGAGLGLAIAKWITEVHGGTITVQSQVGVGSVFRVSLPIMAEEPRAIVLSELQVETPQI